MDKDQQKNAEAALFGTTATANPVRRVVTGRMEVTLPPLTLRAVGTVVPPPEILLQTAIVDARGKVEEGQLIVAVAHVWRRIYDEIRRDPNFLFRFPANPRAFEEFIAAAYEQTGEWDDVILTPRSGDGGRDVIVVKHGFGALRFLEQTKAHSPHHLVTHNDVRAMLGTLLRDQRASKAIITTTSDFEPGVLNGPEFNVFLPTRLEVRNGTQLLKWLDSIKKTT